MSDNKIFALNSINQNRHFDFDSTLLSNKVFNTFMRQWGVVVRGSLITRVQEMEELPSEMRKELKNLWLNRLFQRGKINMILEKFKKTIDSKVMAIPSDFVLAEDQENARIRGSEALEEDDLLDKVREKRAKIIQLRIKVETLRKLKNARSAE